MARTLIDEIREANERSNQAYREGNIAGARASAATMSRLTEQAMASPKGGYTRYKDSVNQMAADPYAEIKRQQEALLAAQKQARIQALGAQRQSALSALEAERGTVAPQYLKQRGQLSTTAQQAARGAEQSLAARGLTRSGSAVQGDIARNVALQQGMTDIGEAEAATFANIAQRQTAAEQAYAQGVAQAESESAATAAQNEINRLMQAQQAQEATLASQAQAQFEQQKMAQEQANKLQIEQLRIAAAEAQAQGNFERSQELARLKNELEADTIRLRASTRTGGNGGGGGVGSGVIKLTGTQQKIADDLVDNIKASPGSMSRILAGVTDPAIKSYLMMIYGSQATGVTPTGYSDWSVTRAQEKNQPFVPSWLRIPGVNY